MVHCFGILTLLLILTNLQFPFARQIPLCSFDGKNHRMKVERVSGQVPVNNATNLELLVISPNMRRGQKSAEADTTQPIIGLENSLKTYNLTENKTLDSELGPALFFLIHAYRGIES
jgi:hypothetical protein